MEALLLHVLCCGSYTGPRDPKRAVRTREAVWWEEGHAAPALSARRCRRRASAGSRVQRPPPALDKENACLQLERPFFESELAPLMAQHGYAALYYARARRQVPAAGRQPWATVGSYSGATAGSDC